MQNICKRFFMLCVAVAILLFVFVSGFLVSQAGQYKLSLAYLITCVSLILIAAVGYFLFTRVGFFWGGCFIFITLIAIYVATIVFNVLATEKGEGRIIGCTVASCCLASTPWVLYSVGAIFIDSSPANARIQHKFSSICSLILIVASFLDILLTFSDILAFTVLFTAILMIAISYSLRTIFFNDFVVLFALVWSAVMFGMRVAEKGKYLDIVYLYADIARVLIIIGALIYFVLLSTRKGNQILCKTADFFGVYDKDNDGNKVIYQPVQKSVSKKNKNTLSSYKLFSNLAITVIAVAGIIVGVTLEGARSTRTLGVAMLICVPVLFVLALIFNGVFTSYFVKVKIMEKKISDLQKIADKNQSDIYRIDNELNQNLLKLSQSAEAKNRSSKSKRSTHSVQDDEEKFSKN